MGFAVLIPVQPIWRFCNSSHCHDYHIELWSASSVQVSQVHLCHALLRLYGALCDEIGPQNCKEAIQDLFLFCGVCQFGNIRANDDH